MAVDNGLTPEVDPFARLVSLDAGNVRLCHAQAADFILANHRFVRKYSKVLLRCELGLLVCRMQSGCRLEKLWNSKLDRSSRNYGFAGWREKPALRGNREAPTSGVGM